jgi:hypothetical protein
MTVLSEAGVAFTAAFRSQGVTHAHVPLLPIPALHGRSHQLRCVL